MVIQEESFYVRWMLEVGSLGPYLILLHSFVHDNYGFLTVTMIANDRANIEKFSDDPYGVLKKIL